MKRLLLLIIVIGYSIFFKADTSCHTPGNYDNLIFGNDVYTEDNRVRVFFHIIRNSNGGGYDCFSTADIPSCIQRLNRDYMVATSAYVSFEYAGMDYIDNTDFYNITSYDSFDSQCMFVTNRHTDAIDVYLLPTGSSLAGYANGIPGTALAIGGNYYGNIMGNSSLLSHEMGHCLGLFHTFHGSPTSEPYGCRELVGSHSSTCGDFVLDTEADPFALYDHMTACAWINTTLTDPYNGSLYIPDANQIMADVPSECMWHLTYYQGLRVRAHLATQQILKDRVIPTVAYVQARQFLGNGEEIIMADDSVIAGRNVTIGSNGDVVVPSGGNVTFQAEKKVTMKPGFKVNLGGKFLAKVNTLPEPSYARKNLNETDDYMPLFDHTTWIRVHHNIGDSRVWASVYKNAGDSIFNGKKYRVIKAREIYVEEPTFDSNEWINLFYEDVENKRTYVYDDSRQKDRLLYDFSVQVGDRLPSDLYESNFILKDISTIDNSGYTRKQYTFVHEADTIIWIEGIGNYCDFTRPNHRKFDEVKMLCVKTDNETVYDSEGFVEKTCDDVNQIYEDLLSREAVEEIHIPNPSAIKILRDNQIIIERNGHTYTIMGAEVK